MKQHYKIPASLDRSRLDHEITIAAWDIKARPLPVKVLLYWVGAIFFMFWILTQSWWANASWPALTLWGMWMLGLAVLMGRRSRTGEFNFIKARAAMTYFNRGHRRVLTRRGSKPYGMLSIVGIKNIHERGMIEFIDGDVGQIYGVVGSASRLLFNADRERIMARADAFYKKIDPEVTIAQITTKEPQRVFQQISAIEKRNAALVQRDPDLVKLLGEQAEVLINDVGGQYDSLHQYMLVRARNFKMLKMAHRVIATEYEYSSLYLRECELLDRKSTLEVLGPMYMLRSIDRAQL